MTRMTLIVVLSRCELMPSFTTDSNTSVLAARVAIRVAEVASSWRGNVMKFEAARNEEAFLVCVESDDGSFIRASIPDAQPYGDQSALTINVDLNCDHVTATDVRCTPASFDILIEHPPAPHWAHLSNPTPSDEDAIEWDADSTVLQPRSEFTELLMSPA
ncbi:hypothetical protein [Rhizobium oryzicola]|uniref:Uncharacterized protein n=1 Tax=Rhizobium oryzicola TaxID=1232668 RepID=A0ABT8SYW8_9HYPH|nr:hypothetical protein [Rhizobium oryzicola]MDO1583603.1 hypothetical protein [Rhizobium oryzicola]